ncbi:MAG: hypothetical protein WKG07_02850 [Hymenobacter sp.]
MDMNDRLKVVESRLESVDNRLESVDNRLGNVENILLQAVDNIQQISKAVNRTAEVSYCNNSRNSADALTSGNGKVTIALSCC